MFRYILVKGTQDKRTKMDWEGGKEERDDLFWSVKVILKEIWLLGKNISIET